MTLTLWGRKKGDFYKWKFETWEQLSTTTSGDKKVRNQIHFKEYFSLWFYKAVEVGVDELQILFVEYVWFLVVDGKRMNEYALEDLKASLNK